MFRKPRKPVSVDTLRTRAAKSAAQAKEDAKAVTFAEESSIAQAYVSRLADILQQRVDDDAKQRAEREQIAAKLSVAQSNAFDLSDRIERAKHETDDALKLGDVELASSHSSAGVAMTAALNRAQMLIGSLTDSYRSIPVSDLSQDERDSLPVLRKTALSPAASHKYAVHKPDVNAEYRRLGEYVRTHPAPMKNTPTPMRVA
jgi:hypothetical protein